MQVSGSHLDLIRAAYALYGVNVFDMVSIVPHSGEERTQQIDELEQVVALTLT